MDNIEVERAYTTPYSNSSLLPLLMMSLLTQKHTPKTKESIREKYDYIIVGAGSGGSVVANRLSEVNCVDVLLLEAGKSPPLLTEIPAIGRSFLGSDIDWNYLTAPQNRTGAALKYRRLAWPSGKVIGGSSIVNAMLNVRGHRRIYDDWAAQGATGWSYKELLPYFKKLERYNGPQDKDKRRYHGRFGPVNIETPRYDSQYGRAVLDAARSLCIPIHDINGRIQKGFSNITITSKGGQRVSAAKAYLVPAENRTNLDIVPNAFVKKIIIEDGRAVGVEVDFAGERRAIRAEREVILSAGTVNSAQLLMLSGIGPKEHLQKLKIPVVANLPVGLNLQDHCGSVMSYTISAKEPSFSSKLSDAQNIREYIDSRKGPLNSAIGVTNVAFLSNDRNASIEAVPDQELYFLEGVPEFILKFQMNMKPKVYEAVFAPTENKTNVWCISQLLHPRSRGNVTLESSNPYHPPIIDPNYFDDDQDLIDVVEGLKRCNEILSRHSLKKLGIRLSSEKYPGCEKFDLNSDDYLRCQVQSFTFSLTHPVGTAKMGEPGDPTAVVDPNLRVIGVKGLRVVDASVMPIIPTGNTHVPTLMLAEKASDMIKEDIPICKD